nr:MAG: hypothetical protein [Bacteriophage sp.]
MACLKKLDSNITFDCANFVLTGGTGEIDEAIVINSSDISAISETGGVGTITMITGKKGYVVNSVNNSVMYQEAIKANDIVPAAEDQSVVIKVMSTMDSTAYRVALTSLLKGNFRVALKSKSGNYYLAGMFCGLEASDLATDSSTGGITTITLKTPEASTGDMLVTLTKAAYDGLKVAKV